LNYIQNQISTWKREFLENADLAFGGSSSKSKQLVDKEVVTQKLHIDLKRNTQLILLAIINHPTLVDVYSELQHFDTQLFDINENRDYLTTNAYLNTLNQVAELISPAFILFKKIMDDYNYAKQIVQQILEKVLKSYLKQTLKSQIMAINISDDNFEKDTNALKQQLKQIDSFNYKQVSDNYRKISP